MFFINTSRARSTQDRPNPFTIRSQRFRSAFAVPDHSYDLPQTELISTQTAPNLAHSTRPDAIQGCPGTSSVRDRFGIGFGSVFGWFWYRFRVGWDRFGIGVGSVWDRFGIVFGSVWDKFWIDLGSIWDRFGIDFGLV